jgi:hypothetical protein
VVPLVGGQGAVRAEASKGTKVWARLQLGVGQARSKKLRKSPPPLFDERLASRRGATQKQGRELERGHGRCFLRKTR